MRIPALSCAAFLVLCMEGLSSARQVNIDPEPQKGSSLLILELSSQGSYWNPGLKDAAPVRYRTEGLSTYRFQGILGSGVPIVTVAYERPWNGANVRQPEMLAARRDERASLERYTAGIDLQPVVLHFFPTLGESYLLETLASAEVSHEEALFFGRAEVSSTFYYLPSNATVDLVHRTVKGATKLQAGSSLGFRTRFIENEVSVSLTASRRYSLRAGYYDLAWERPSNNNSQFRIADSAGAYPILYDTTYRTQGLSVRIENLDSSSPGWNADLRVRIGLKNRIHAALERQLQENEALRFFGLNGNLWYNWYLTRNRSGILSGFFLSLGGTADLRHWQIEVMDAQGNVITAKSVDEDNLFQVFTRIGYRF